MSSKKSSQRAEELRKDIPIVEHEWDVDKIFKHFNIDPQKGLSSDQVLKQRAEHGENRLTPPKTVQGIYIHFKAVSVQLSPYFKPLTLCYQRSRYCNCDTFAPWQARCSSVAYHRLIHNVNSMWSAIQELCESP